LRENVKVPTPIHSPFVIICYDTLIIFSFNWWNEDMFFMVWEETQVRYLSNEIFAWIIIMNGQVDRLWASGLVIQRERIFLLHAFFKYNTESQLFFNPNVLQGGQSIKQPKISQKEHTSTHQEFFYCSAVSLIRRNI
jgi:hypothetical protein